MRRRVVADVTGRTLKGAIREEVDRQARIVTDELSSYTGIGPEFEGGHESVCHGTKEYVRGDVHTNTAESSHALVKRGIVGIYHNVSREYLHRYLWQFDFLWNNRYANDGERLVAGIQGAEGKRLTYRTSKLSGKCMTIEKRATIEFKDITAVELHCTGCGSVAIRKLSKLMTLPPVCGNCQAIWHINGSSEGNDLLAFLQTLGRYAKVERPYNIRLQIDGLDNAE